MMSLAKTFLAIGIAVIFAVFIGYSLYTIYESPYEQLGCSQYNCYQFQERCQYLIGSDVENCYNEVTASSEWKSCNDALTTCNNEASALQYGYDRNNFFILIIIGMAAIIAGTYYRRWEGIGSGFIGGGVLVVLWSLAYTWSYWLTWPKYIKVAALGLVLVLLIYLGYTKIEGKLGNKNEKKKGKKK